MPNKRSRAWRRTQRERVMINRRARYNIDPENDVRQLGQLAKTCPVNWDNVYREKNWKLIYLRNRKISRAKQLGYLWPDPYRKLQKLIED